MPQQRIKAPPHFIINPALVPLAWTGDAWGYRAFKNPDWLNSVWLGTVWNVMTLPQRFAYQALRPLLVGDLRHALYGAMVLLPLFLAFIIMGLMGRLRMLPYKIDVVAHSYVMTEDEAGRAIAAGMTEPVKIVSHMQG